MNNRTVYNIQDMYQDHSHCRCENVLEALHLSDTSSVTQKKDGELTSSADIPNTEIGGWPSNIG